MDPKSLLDELMGRERDVPLDQRSMKAMRYDDPLVCKYQIAGLCPHRLFKNTKSDLGICPYEVHEDHVEWESIITDYNSHDDREKERYEKRLLRYLEDLIREMDKKIARAKDRAEKESAPREIKVDDQMRLQDLQMRAKEALIKSQHLGEEGDVDQSLMLAQQAEAYKKQHDELYKRLTTPDRIMTVCEVCGVFINTIDVDPSKNGGKIPQPILRTEKNPGPQDHLTGKQYLGWKSIRETFSMLKEKFDQIGSRPAEEERPRERSPVRASSPRRDNDRRERRDERDQRDTRDYRGSDNRSGGGSGGGYRDDRRGGYRDDRGGGGGGYRDDRGGGGGDNRGYGNQGGSRYEDYGGRRRY